jgi:hypothetical protein
LRKDRQNAIQTTKTTHSTMRSITSGVEGVGHELYMGNFFSSPVYVVTCTQVVSTVGLRQNHKGMPWGFDSERLKLKWGDVCARVRGKLTALIW